MYSAVISLYLNTLQKLLKEQEEQPCGIMLEEFANISWYGADKFLSVCRSYLVNVTLVIQDASQLILHYGQRQANVILSMVGNIISGQVSGESAKMLSERFGKILQDKESMTHNGFDTSVNKSKQLDYAIPQSTIAALSAGEVVGVELWEEYIFRKLQKAANSDVKVQRQQSQKFWKRDSAIYPKTIRPDILIYKGDDTIVIDTKWKLISDFTPADDDLKQIFVYNLFWKCNHSVLLYPAIEYQKQSGTYFKFQQQTFKETNCLVATCNVFSENYMLDKNIGVKILNEIVFSLFSDS